MFEPPIKSLSGIKWIPIAHGEEPESILMGYAVIQDILYCMHGFRVAMPYSSGWTERIAWEDDKNNLGSGILWRSRITKDYVKAMDMGVQSMALEGIQLSEDEQEWDMKWLMLSRILNRSEQKWLPSKIHEHFYHIIGVPLSSGEIMEDYPNILLKEEDKRSPYVAHRDEIKIGFKAEGGAYELQLFRIRAIGDKIKAISPEASKVMSDIQPIIQILGGILQTLVIDNCYWAGVFIPVNVEDWNIDVSQMITSFSDGLESGKARWMIKRYDRRFDAFDARIIENMAIACRNHQLASNEHGLWMVRSMQHFLGEVGYGKTVEEVKNKLFGLLSKTSLRGVGHSVDGKFYMRKTRIAERIYIFEESICIQICNDFAWMASQMDNGAFLHMAWQNTVYETLSQEIPGNPLPWGETLPSLMDSRIHRFLAEWGTPTNF